MRLPLRSILGLPLADITGPVGSDGDVDRVSVGDGKGAALLSSFAASPSLHKPPAKEDKVQLTLVHAPGRARVLLRLTYTQRRPRSLQFEHAMRRPSSPTSSPEMSS
jgi:hypothetical protein